jgi:hypothetical protein
MSYRVEQTDPLTLLGELPSQWAQTCVTSPRRDEPVSYLLAVLDEVRRVLREDGTLWLALTRGGNSHELTQALKETSWLRPEALRSTPRQVVLLTKSERFLFNPRRGLGVTRSPQEPGCPRYPLPQRPGRGCASCPLPRRAWCVPSPGAAGVLPVEVIEWCVLTSTAPYSCGACGAPWTRTAKETRSGRHWRPTCQHHNDRGRCLVIDPFSTTPDTGTVAVRRGRDFLGVELDPDSHETASRRLSHAQGHRR